MRKIVEIERDIAYEKSAEKNYHWIADHCSEVKTEHYIKELTHTRVRLKELKKELKAARKKDRLTAEDKRALKDIRRDTKEAQAMVKLLYEDEFTAEELEQLAAIKEDYKKFGTWACGYVVSTAASIGLGLLLAQVAPNWIWMPVVVAAVVWQYVVEAFVLIRDFKNKN